MTADPHLEAIHEAIGGPCDPNATSAEKGRFKKPKAKAEPDFEALPHDTDAEKSLLCCLFSSAPETFEALRKNHPQASAYFYDERHTRIWRSAIALHASGKLVDPVTVCNALENDGGLWLDARLYIWDFTTRVLPVSYADHYAGILREFWARRHQIEWAQTLERAARAGDVDAVSQAQAMIEEAIAPPAQDLPEIEDAASMVTAPREKPAELVYGLLHRGSKLVLGGSSKSFKTWSLLDLGLSVAYGEPFWSMKVSKGRVLYLNLEVQPEFFTDRVKAVAEAKFIRLESGRLDVWNLRGHAADFRTLLPKIRKRVSECGYALLILDPIYKLLGDADENSAGDMAELMNGIEGLARDVGAAVAFGSHFAKGNASAKESIDRISGSGVFARDPDSILTLTKHEQDDCFAVEATLRNFKPLTPFVVQWQFPLMRRVDLDPAKLKKVGGRKAEHTPDNIIPFIQKKPLSTTDWQKLAKAEEGISERTFYRLHKELKTAERIEEKEGKWILLP